MPYSIDIPYFYWIFVDGRHFLNDGLYRYVLPRERNITIINFTELHDGGHMRNGRMINDGLDADVVGGMTRRRISRYELRNTEKPGLSRVEGGEAYLHKPSISNNLTARPKSVRIRNEAEMDRVEIDPDILRVDQEREKRILEDTQRTEIEEIQGTT